MGEYRGTPTYQRVYGELVRALHPAAAGVLLGALREASEATQVLVASHSPDLLDDDSIETSSLLGVAATAGAT